ncbi:MAG: hypothetical protein JNK79_00670 [Chitinophagaceae bacterium]|nr:hypothetical protein [Chitinophagaceae bacterium]
MRVLDLTIAIPTRNEDKNLETCQGGYPLKKLALFRVSSGEYEQIDENYWSPLDMEVHEHPCLHEPIGEHVAWC